MVDTDSWSAIFAPPQNETLAEKHVRIAQQQEAARISKDIDDAIEKSRKQFEKRKRAIKVLLLGPYNIFTRRTNSPPPRPGRVRQVHHAPKCVSTTRTSPRSPFPDFQLAFCPTYFHREIPIWKVIIQLNLIGYALAVALLARASRLHSSVKRLLTIIEDELEATLSLPSSPSRSNLRPGASPLLPTHPSDHPAFPRSGPSSHASLDLRHDSSDPPLTQAHSALRLRLLPLLSVETNLARQLLPEFGGTPPPLPSSTGWTKWASGACAHSSHPSLSGGGEICVRAGGAWKSILERVSGTLLNSSPDTPQDDPSDDALAQPIQPRSPPLSPKLRSTRPHPSDPTPLLEALVPDIHALWTDPAVHALLKRKGVRLEHSAGFFLNDVLRIGKPGWMPDIGPCPGSPCHLCSHVSQTTLCALDSGRLE
jgi:hypothetical protein